MYSKILFDLDGTLTDTSEGIINSVSYALSKLGIEAGDKTRFYKFIGPPLRNGFEEVCGLKGEDVERCVTYYREYYSEKGVYENRLYDGIKELLKRLYESGRSILLATSKPERFAVEILEKHGIKRYFSHISGADMEGKRDKKTDVIARALELGKITDLSDAVMVGDRLYDIEGARKFGMASIGVLFGFGGRCELEEAGADYIAESAEEIYEIIRTCRT